MTATLKNHALYFTGLAMGLANAGRHRVRGYRTPRPFDSRDAARARSYNEGVVARWESRGQVSWTGKRVLELGPGPDLGTGELIMERGASSYLATDLFRLVETPPLPYVVTTYPEMENVDGPFDVIVSNATLEHFDDVGGTFARLAKLAAPDAQMVHHIDAKTHMRWLKDVDPLNILRYSQRTYKLMTFPGAPNRLRANDYLRLASQAGFDAGVIPGRTAPKSYLAELELGSPYAEAADLDLLTFTLVARLRRGEERP